MPSTRDLPAHQPVIYYRLIAIWVLCEAMLGAIIHGFRIPVSGLVMGSAAIACICLIGWYAPGKGHILKATIVVAIFKMLLSPQAPPPAYIAVFFQGLLGELLFRNRRYYALSCFLLAVLGLLESGLQRIIVLTIIYGNDFWLAVNNFINGLTKQKHPANYSFGIAAGYTVLHLIAGFLVGWWVSRLPARVEKWKEDKRFQIPASAPSFSLPERKRKKKRLKTGLLVIWILLIGLYVQSYYRIGTPLLPAHISVKILLRSLIIVLGWIFIVGPLLKKLLHGWLQKKKSEWAYEVAEVEKLLPAMQQLLIAGWKGSAVARGWKRLGLFSKMVLTNTLSYTPQPGEQEESKLEIYLLTAPVQSGKTTSLVRWSEARNDVHGILTPVVDGKRVFMNAHNRQLFRMEAKDDEREVLEVGRFVFSRSHFERAINVIRDSMHKPGWLVIDEVGPMELRGEGFHDVLREVLSRRQGKIVLVVREKEKMVEKVQTYFALPAVTLINRMDGL